MAIAALTRIAIRQRSILGLLGELPKQQRTRQQSQRRPPEKKKQAAATTSIATSKTKSKTKPTATAARSQKTGSAATNSKTTSKAGGLKNAATMSTASIRSDIFYVTFRLVIVAGDWGAAAAYQEIEVGALMGLLDVLGVEFYVTAGWVWRRRPLGTAGGKRGVVHVQADGAAGTSSVIISPERASASGPPAAASGEACRTTVP